ncbi:MAG: PAS domain-containing protein, partial [Ignavibacteria bacterium]|nr:PAS domain-containing protein [Ignavibacteria bacterium]
MFKETNTKEYISESQEAFGWLADYLQINVFKIKLDGTILYVNDCTRRLFGFDSIEDIYTNNIARFYQSRKDRKLFINELKKSCEVKSFQTELVTKSGNVKTLVISAVLNGDVISGMAIDNTDSKKAQANVENSLSILRTTLESTTDGILLVNNNGQIEDYNKKFLIMWNIPVSIADTGDDDKLINFVLDQLLSPDDFVKKVRYLYANPKEESFDILEFKDGRVFERYSKPQRQGEEIIGRIWSFTDTTESKTTRRELDENIIKYKTLFDTANDAILLMNKEFFIDCNSRALDLYGCLRDEIIGATPFKFSPPKQPDGQSSKEKAMELIEKALSGEPLFFEWKHIKLNGKEFDAEVGLNKVRFNNEDMIQAIVRDITDRKRSELLRDAVYKISQAANTARDLNHLYNEIHKTISGFINANNFYIALFDSEKDML